MASKTVTIGLFTKTTEIKPTLVWRGGGHGILISLAAKLEGYTYQLGNHPAALNEKPTGSTQ